MTTEQTSIVTPKPRRGRYRLLEGDSFRWLTRRADASIHAVVTDPPFGVVEYHPDQIEKRNNGAGGMWRLPQTYDGYTRRPMPRFTTLTTKHLHEISRFQGRLAPELFRVLVPGGHVMIATQTLLSHLVINAFVLVDFQLRGQIARTVNTLRGGDRPKFAHRRVSQFIRGSALCLGAVAAVQEAPRWGCAGQSQEVENWRVEAALKRHTVSRSDSVWTCPGRGEKYRGPSLFEATGIHETTRCCCPAAGARCDS